MNKLMVLTCCICLLFSVGDASALNLEDVMTAALENDASLADARSKLLIAGNNLLQAAPLYGSTLVFSGTAKGQPSVSSIAPQSGGAGQVSAEPAVTYTSQLTVPLFSWLKFGLDGTAAAESVSGSLSLTVTPQLRGADQSALSWQRAVIEAQNAVRTTLLAVRREYRAVLTARLEYEYRSAAVRSAQNELVRIEYLVELGKARKSEELTAYSALMDAQGELDAAENRLSQAVVSLQTRTALESLAPESLEAMVEDPRRTLVDAEVWVQRSASMLLADLDIQSREGTVLSATALPAVSVGGTITDQQAWSVTARVSLSPDFLFQKERSSAAENLLIQRRGYESTEQNVRSSWKNESAALAMAERNYANAVRFLESAQLFYDEMSLLLERGEVSLSALDTAQERLLSARWQMQKALESLENARDQLDITWQIADSR